MQPQKTLEQRLEKFPELVARIDHILGIAENKDKLINANEVEDRVTEELQKLGQEIIQSWAEKESLRQSENFQNIDKRSYKNGKKNSIGIQNTVG